jgi:ABC-type lipoprotein release transport system permease subunit
MRFEWFIALRYLSSRRKQSFISIISVISIGGVALGITTVILVISILNGFEHGLKEKFLANEAHIRVQSLSGRYFPDYQDKIEEIKAIEGVVAASPVVYVQSVVWPKDEATITGTIYIKGIDQEQEDRVTGFSKFVDGSVDFKFSPVVEMARLMADETITGGIVLGFHVAHRLRIDMGDIIRLIPEMVESPVHPGTFLARIKNFVVIGLYHSGLYIHDNAFGFIDLETAQALYKRENEINTIEVRTTDAEIAPLVSERIQMGRFLFDIDSKVHKVQSDLDNNIISEDLRQTFKTGDISLSPDTMILTGLDGERWKIMDGSQTYVVQKARGKLNIYAPIRLGAGHRPMTTSWMDRQAPLFNALELEKLLTLIIEALIILVAAFNIASTLIMVVMEKTQDIGILRAMGTAKGSIRNVFLIQGSIIGLLGGILGTGLGVALCWLLELQNVRPSRWLALVVLLPIVLQILLAYRNTVLNLSFKVLCSLFWLATIGLALYCIATPIYLNNVFGQDFSQVYQLNRLPVKINWFFVVFINVLSFVICLSMSIIPAWQATNKNPVEALRYE